MCRNNISYYLNSNKIHCIHAWRSICSSSPRTPDTRIQQNSKKYYSITKANNVAFRYLSLPQLEELENLK